MKIKITESQAKRLNLLKEDMTPLAKFEDYCKNKSKELDKLYLYVVNYSILDILDEKIDINKINTEVEAIDKSLVQFSNLTYDYYKKLPEDQTIGDRIDNAYDNLNNKLSTLTNILVPLEMIQNENKQHRISNSFSDVKPLDISGIQH